MNTYIRTLGTTVILTLSVCGLSLAQTPATKPKADTLRRELTIVTDRTIQIPIERPLPIAIVRKEPTLSPLNLGYASFGTMPAIRSAKRVDGLSPLAEGGFISGKRGYANLGMGSLSSVRADLGYLILSDAKNRLSFDISHRSSFEWLTEESAENRTRAQASHSVGAFSFDHLFDASVLQVYAGYAHRYHNYYGLINRPETPGESSGSTDYTSSDNSHIHSLSLGMGLKTLKAASPSVLYNAHFDYGHNFRRVMINGQERKFVEYYPALTLNLQTNGSESLSWGVDAHTALVYTQPKGSVLFSEYEKERSGKANFMAQGAPFVSLSGGNGSINYKLKAGPGVMINIGNAGKLAFYPLVDASLSFAKSYRFYLTSRGGVRANDMRAVYAENPFVDPRFIPDPARELVDARLGFAAGISPGLSLDIYVGGKYTAHDNFFAIKRLEGARAENFNDKFCYQLGFAPYYGDSFVRSAGLDLKYNYRGLFALNIGGRYDHWQLYHADTDIASGKPSFTAYALVEASPIDKLRLSLEYRLRAGVKYEDGFAHQPFSMKENRINDAHRLNARANYRLNDTFSLYAEGNNLLFHRYSDFYGFPARGASALIGCNINF